MTIAVQNADARGAVAINNAITDAFVKHYWKVAKLRYDDVTRRLEHAVGDARVRRDLLERRLEVASAGAVYVGSQASLDAAAARFAEIEQLVGLARGQYAADTANLQADLNPPMAFSHAARYEMLRNSADFRETEALIAHDAGQYTTLRSGVKAAFPGITGFEDKLRQERAALSALRIRTLNAPDAYSQSLLNTATQTVRDRSAVIGDRVRLASLNDQLSAMTQALAHSASGEPSMGALRAERDASEAQFQTLSIA